MPLIKKGIRAIFHLLKKIIFFVVSCIEVPIFLLRNPMIFKNEIVYVFWHWSFGHTVSGIDYASRLYYPYRISLIYILHPGSNAYLPYCFAHNMDAFIYKSILAPGRGGEDVVKYNFLRFTLLLLSGILKKFQVIEHSNVYKTVSLAENRLLYGQEATGKFESYPDWTGYIRLLRNNIGRKPKLPDALFHQCRIGIEKAYPYFFSKPFVTLLLRCKGRGAAFETDSRCAGPQENYSSAVRFITENGYHVVGTGETNHSHFESIAGYYSLESVDIAQSLLNLFLLMHCALFIGQQSGPLILSNSCGIRCLITDALPYRDGTFCEDDIILFKHLRDQKTGKILSLVDVYKNHQDLAYGFHFKEKNIGIEPNTSDEILKSVQESLSALRGVRILSQEEVLLCEIFLGIIPEGMRLRYQKNKPPLHILRNLRSELLGDKL